jgi:hypothetical protein
MATGDQLVRGLAPAGLIGAVVATRDFEPADYLKNPSQATRLIAPGSSSEAELLLAEPGRDAVGYRLDVCLRESAALLRCAGGAG